MCLGTVALVFQLYKKARSYKRSSYENFISCALKLVFMPQTLEEKLLK